MDKYQWHSPDSQAAADYVEGRLKDRRLFEEHLDECTRCRLDVEALQRMRGQTRTWEEEEPYQRPRTYKPLFSGLALALPVAIVLIGLYLTPRRPQVAPSVDAGARWQTGAKARSLTILGQSVLLGPHSRLEQVAPARLRLASGQVRVRSLEVETDQVEIQAVGADFQVFHAKGRTRVHLFAGSLRVRKRNGGQVVILHSKQPDWPRVAR